MRRFKIITLGCKVNTYESEAISEMLINAQYVKDEDGPDVVIVNTCAVTSIAASKSRKTLHKVKRLYPSSCLVCLGCYSQLDGENLTACDIVLGTKNKNKIVSLIDNYFEEKNKKIELDNPRNRKQYEDIHIVKYSEKTRAFVKIQDGCDNFCSYCIIPFTRGKSLSRPKNDILKEVHDLVQNGYKEIVITGIDLASYGKEEGTSLLELLKDILKQEKNILRLRISSLEASQIDEEFIDFLKTEDRIASHLHIPLQSGSDTVLKRMNRKYDKASFLKKIKMIKSIDKDIALACDVIVGFPLESEEEFQECIDFIYEASFNYLHVFPYSIRKNTVASKLEQVPSEIKKQRVQKLLTIGKKLQEDYYKKHEGQILEVLFETCQNNIWKGYSSNYIEVKVKSKENLHNKMYKVQYHFDGYSTLIEQLNFCQKSKNH